MLQLFKENRIQNYFFILIYVLLLRIHTFFNSYGPVPKVDSILYDAIGQGEWDTTWGMKIISVLLIFYHVMYINRILIVNNLAFGNPMYPGALYVLFLSLLPEIHPLDPMLVGNTFLILAIYHLFQAVHRNQRSKRLFNAGFLICIASVCNINYLFLMPFLILASNSLIVVRNRDFLLYFLGFGTVVYFLGTYWYLTEGVSHALHKLTGYFHWFEYDFLREEYGVVKTAILGSLVLLSLIGFRQIVSKTNIFVRSKLHFLFNLLLYSILLVGIGFHVDLAHIQILFLPLSLLLGLYLFNLARPVIAEGIHFILLVLVVLSQYFL